MKNIFKLCFLSPLANRSKTIGAKALIVLRILMQKILSRFVSKDNRVKSDISGSRKNFIKNIEE